MTVYIASTHAHVQRLVSGAEISVQLCECVSPKGTNAEDIHNKMFSVYGEECFSLKAIYKSVEKFSRGRSKVADDARPSVEVAEVTLKRLLCCGF
jgi:hypothetical protein